jgi:hypothetical protein
MQTQLKSVLIALSIILLPMSLVFGAIAYSQVQLQPLVYVPIVKTSPETPTPTATATPTNTPTATATLPPGVTPSATPTTTPNPDLCQLNPNPASAPNSPVMIDDIDKENENVFLRNVSGANVDLTGWRMCSINGHQEHTGIGGLLTPGQVRLFHYAGPGAIWSDNQRDDGALYNAAGQLIAYDENID